MIPAVKASTLISYILLFKWPDWKKYSDLKTVHLNTAEQPKHGSAILLKYNWNVLLHVFSCVFNQLQTPTLDMLLTKNKKPTTKISYNNNINTICIEFLGLLHMYLMKNVYIWISEISIYDDTLYHSKKDHSSINIRCKETRDLLLYTHLLP